MRWKDEIIHLMGLMSFHRITQQELADAIDYNKETIYRWLKDPEKYQKKFPMIEHGIKKIIEKQEENKND
jgi:DNA transposition AAA+ family ATPase